MVIGSVVEAWGVLRTSIIVGISLLSILPSCLELGGVPTSPCSSHASKSQCVAVYSVRQAHPTPGFP